MSDEESLRGISHFVSQSLIVVLHSKRTTQFVRSLLSTAFSWGLDMTLVMKVFGEEGEHEDTSDDLDW